MISRRIYREVILDDFYVRSINNAEMIRKEAIKYEPHRFNIMVPNTDMMTNVNLGFLKWAFGKDFSQEYYKFLEKSVFLPKPNKKNDDVDDHWDDDEDKEHITISNAYSRVYAPTESSIRKRVNRVELPYIKTINDASTYIHEFMHYLRFTKFPKMCLNNMNDEVLSVFSQLLYGHFCDIYGELKFGDLSMMLSEVDSRINEDLARATSFDDMSSLHKLPPNPTPEQIEQYTSFKEKTLPACKYFFSSVYAIRLLSLFLLNEMAIRKQLKAIAHGGVSIDQVLRENNISLHDDATVDNVMGYMRTRSLQVKR